MIIAVDYDGTLHDGSKPNLDLISRLRNEQRRGNIVILWTCREGKRLLEAVKTLQKAGFAPNFVNCNAPMAVKAMGHDSRKVFADVYIDDKNAIWR